MLSIQDISFLYREQLIGFSEARSLIAQVDPGFHVARDPELDVYVTLVEQRQNEEKSLEAEPPDVP